MLLFKQTKEYSYRDPAAYIENGTIYLFFTLVENTPERQYFYVAASSISPYKYAMFYHGDNEDAYLFGASLAVAFSDDLINWSEK